MNKDILVVGSVALDTITTPLGKVKDALGGSAVYFSTSARIFNPVNIVAVVGEDFPRKHLAYLRKKKINLSGLEIVKGKTFRWEGEYNWDFSNPRTISTHLNVFADFKPKVPKIHQDNKYVFLANIDPEVQNKVLSQITKPKIVACDTMNYWIENKLNHLLKLLRHVDIFLVNESEARQITQENNLVKAGKKMLKLGPKIIIVKKGEHGVLLFLEDTIFSIPAFLLESVFDPTGAGDTFAGGFMGYLASCSKYSKKSLKTALVYGTIMATFAVEDFSLGRLGSVTFSKITTRLEKFRKSSLF